MSLPFLGGGSYADDEGSADGKHPAVTGSQRLSEKGHTSVCPNNYY